MNTRSVGTLRMQIVQSGDELAAIGPAWTALWTEVDGVVFQSHQWVMAWWTTLPADHRYKLRIGLVWEGTALKAVFPLVITPRKGIRFLEWAAISCTDYPDILCARDCHIQTLQSLWAAIQKAGGYDIAQLLRLLPGARARDLIGGAVTQSNRRSELNYRVTGNFTGPGGWLAQQSKKTRQNYRRGRQYLEDQGTVRFRLIDPTTEPLPPLVEQFSALKRKWLADKDQHSELLDTESNSIAALVDVLGTLGILRVFVLECDGTAIAISFNFEQHGALMALLTTYDPIYERGSPGTLLIADYIQWAADHGLRTVDFLCGAEAFKNRFSTESFLLEGRFAARTLLGHAAMAVYDTLPAIRRLVASLRLTKPEPTPGITRAEAAE